MKSNQLCDVEKGTSFDKMSRNVITEHAKFILTGDRLTTSGCLAEFEFSPHHTVSSLLNANDAANMQNQKQSL